MYGLKSILFIFAYNSGLKLAIGTNQPPTSSSSTPTTTPSTPTTPGGTRLAMFKNFFKYA